MELALIIVSLLVVYFGSEMLLRKSFNIKRAKLSDATAKKVFLWGRVIILIITLSFIPLVSSTGDFRDVFLLLIFQTAALAFLEAYLQWKYIQESKEYVVTLFAMLVNISFLFIFSVVYF